MSGLLARPRPAVTKTRTSRLSLTVARSERRRSDRELSAAQVMKAIAAPERVAARSWRLRIEMRSAAGVLPALPLSGDSSGQRRQRLPHRSEWPPAAGAFV